MKAEQLRELSIEELKKTIIDTEIIIIQFYLPGYYKLAPNVGLAKVNL